MSRYSAFGIHLLISLGIFFVLTYLVVFEWYPGIFFDTDGGWRGIRIIVLVDLVLGPLLTLVVFKAGKPGLKMDLTLIGLLQAVCLAAGTYIVWDERPVAVVYLDSRFEVLTREDFQFLPADERPKWAKYPGDSPKWISVIVPEDIEDAAAFRKSYFRSDRNTATAVEYYAPFDPLHEQFVGKPRSLEVILKRPGAQDALDKWVLEHGGTIDDYAFYTFSARYAYRYLGFRKSNGERLDFLDTVPI